MEMKSIIRQIKRWVIDHRADIILVVGVILISLLSFAMGYIAAKQEAKQPLRFETIDYDYMTMTKD